MKKSLNGWATMEYIIGAVLIASLVGAMLGVFREKIVKAIEDQVNIDITSAQDAYNKK